MNEKIPEWLINFLGDESARAEGYAVIRNAKRAYTATTKAEVEEFKRTGIWPESATRVRLIGEPVT